MKDIVPGWRLRVVLACFFLSGVAGLVYEVAWTKALGLVFGHTVYAIAVVLAAFMAGLAAGSTYLGKRFGAHTQPVRVYGWIELLVGATGALSLLGLYGVRLLYVATYHHVSDSVPITEALRFVGSMVVLLLPTFLMGGTLPILTAGITRSSSELGATVGQLYWINTAGAVIGALAAGFLLLPWAGLRMTVAIGVLCNVLAGCLALATSHSSVQPTFDETQRSAISTSARMPAFLLSAFALVGATSIAYEISWTRLLATTLGSSTYSFTIMLATFLAGIALGSRIFESWAVRGKEVSIATFGTTQIFTGLGALFFLVLSVRMPAIAWEIVTSSHKNFRGLLLAQFAICALSMLPTATAFGFNFPAVASLIASKEERGASYSTGVGRAYAANTVGAILGSIVAAFWLVPSLGGFRAVALTGVANLLLAVLLFARGRPRRTLELAASSAVAVVVVVAGWSGVLYDPVLANFSVTNHPEGYSANLSADEIAHSVDMLHTEDGLNATISVLRSEEGLTLETNGKADASTGDLISQLMLGHLGMIFQNAPRKVLVIGFGSGMTISAVARYPEVQQIDCVEIEPAVLRAAPYLQPLNRGVLNDPRLRIITDDARNFLFTTRDRYDLIISEPSNPWIAGIATLFTDEFYGEVRSRLAPGGMMVQWVQAYSLFPQDVKMILRTLVPHFSQASVWRGALGDFIILCQTDRSRLSMDRLRQLWLVPALRSDFAALGLSLPEGLIAYHLLDDSDLRRLVTNAERNTDDKTRLEYRAPLAIFAGNTIADNMRMLSDERATLFPASISLDNARESSIAAAQTALFLGDNENAGRYIAAIAEEPAALEAELLRANWLVATKRFDDSRAAFAEAVKLDPSSIPARMGLATQALHDKDYDASERTLHDVLDLEPGYLPALEAYALAEAGRGNWKEALAWQTRRVVGDPSRPFASVLFLANLLVRTGDNRDAEGLYAELLHRDPYNGPAHTALGELYRSEQRWDEARVQLEVVVRYFPIASPDEYVSLADVYRRMGRSRDAEYCLKRGAEIFPNDPSLFRASNGD
jgi:spermidine synthase